MTVLDYFFGQFSYPIPSEVFESVFAGRGIKTDDDVSDLERKEIDLCLADTLVILSRTSQGFTNRTGSDAFSTTIKGDYIPLSDRRAMRDEANRIYKRYGEDDKVRSQNAINVYL